MRQELVHATGIARKGSFDFYLGGKVSWTLTFVPKTIASGRKHVTTLQEGSVDPWKLLGLISSLYSPSCAFLIMDNFILYEYSIELNSVHFRW
jgi:hypothetical protein